MKKAYVVIVNALLFYYLVSIFNGVAIKGNSIISVTLVGIVFGLVMMSVPSILQFFKITNTTGAKLLLSLVLSFIFFFILHSGVGNIASIGKTTINLDLTKKAEIVLNSALQTLVIVSILSAFASVGLQKLSQGSLGGK